MSPPMLRAIGRFLKYATGVGYPKGLVASEETIAREAPKVVLARGRVVTAVSSLQAELVRLERALSDA